MPTPREFRMTIDREDLPKVLALLGDEADDRLRGWVLVPAGWVAAETEGSESHRPGTERSS
jgi:hypothetical protein